jgi:hypothetical protein
MLLLLLLRMLLLLLRNRLTFVTFVRSCSPGRCRRSWSHR